MSNLLDLVTGGEPIDAAVQANVTVDQSVYIAIAAIIVGIMLLILFSVVLHKYA
jgi:hypothetical protein